MNAMAKGIAHVSFAGGGFFLPARNPYDRQLLVEHVSECVRTKGHVQVLMGDQLWMVHRNSGPSTTPCTRCGMAVPTAFYFRGSGEACYCPTCALGQDVESVQLGAPRRKAV
jgi:hypothetical protein